MREAPPTASQLVGMTRQKKGSSWMRKTILEAIDVLGAVYFLKSKTHSDISIAVAQEFCYHHL